MVSIDLRKAQGRSGAKSGMVARPRELVFARRYRATGVPISSIQKYAASQQIRRDATNDESSLRAEFLDNWNDLNPSRSEIIRATSEEAAKKKAAAGDRQCCARSILSHKLHGNLRIIETGFSGLAIVLNRPGGSSHPSAFMLGGSIAVSCTGRSFPDFRSGGEIHRS
jgi:hypothetical protein